MAKVSSYTSLAAADVVDSDVLYVVDASAGSSGSRKITMANLRTALGTLGLNPPTTLPFQINGTTQVNLTDGVFAPETTNDVDLGSSSKQFKDLYIDGTANIDALVADTADINGGTVDGATIGGSTPGAGTFTNLAATGTTIIATATPASAGATGTAGQIAWDADYIYVCTATNTWKRVAIATW